MFPALKKNSCWDVTITHSRMNRGSTIKHSTLPQPIHKSTLGVSGCLQPLLLTLLTFLTCTTHTSSAFKKREDKSFTLPSCCSSLISHFCCHHRAATTGVRLPQVFPTRQTLHLTQSRHPNMDAVELRWVFINTGRWPKCGQLHQEVVLFPSPSPAHKQPLCCA